MFTTVTYEFLFGLKRDRLVGNIFKGQREGNNPWSRRNTCKVSVHLNVGLTLPATLGTKHEVRVLGDRKQLLLGVLALGAYPFVQRHFDLRVEQ